jgi:glycosyltransferase involved in cell wall biosynthesis
VIQNGYDGIIPALLSTGGPVVAGNFFVIGYVGAFYYTPETRATVMDPWRKRPMRHWLHYSPRREDWLYRSPYYFFKAMRRMFENHPHLRDRVRVRFVGDKPGWLTEQVEENGLSEVVESLGRLSHRECLKFQANCNALLLTSVKVPGGRDYCIAGKTFEYISAGRPIIAFAAEGEQRDFLESSGTAVLCDPDDADASARALAEMINGVHSLSPNVPFLSGFHRRETARKLAEITLAICPNGGKRPTTEAHHA